MFDISVSPKLAAAGPSSFEERERRRRRKRRRRAAVLGIVLGAIAQRATVRAIGSSLSYKDETHRSLPFPSVRRESEVTSEREREREIFCPSVQINKRQDHVGRSRE